MSTSIAPMPVLSKAGKGYAEVGLAIGVVFIVALLMVPIPGLLLDLLLATSKTTSDEPMLSASSMSSMRPGMGTMSSATMNTTPSASPTSA